MSYLAIVIGIALLVALIAMRIRLWITLFATSIAVAILSRGLIGVVELFTSIDRVTIDIVAISLLVATFVELYRMNRGIEGIGQELVKLFRNPIAVITAVPAILGLLPVAGGALMSAPIVDSVGDSMRLDRVRKLFVNVWFRHVIFLVYPISTPLIMAALLSGVDLWGLIGRQIPIAIAMALIGIAIGIPRASTPVSVVRQRVDYSKLLKCFTPMLSAIALSLALSRYTDYRLPIPLGRVSMVIGLTTGIVLNLALLSSRKLEDLISALRSRTVIELTLAAYGAMLLRRAFILADIGNVAASVASYIPPLIIVTAIPMLFAFLTGSPTSGIALSFPILRELVNLNTSTASLAYVSAFLGYLGSPLHLCYIYTAQYLGIDYVEGYRYMVPAIISTIAIAITLYIALQ